MNRSVKMAYIADMVSGYKDYVMGKRRMNLNQYRSGLSTMVIIYPRSYWGRNTRCVGSIMMIPQTIGGSINYAALKWTALVCHRT